jgi:mercuric ion transport protein
MNRAWRQGWPALPGVAVSMVPKLACPACWPAYAGLLTSLGLGFLLATAYLLPLTASFLALALVSLVFRARRRRGFGPFLLGLLATAGILAGKFVRASNPAMYAAVGLLVVATLWNSWPRRAAACPARHAGEIG